ncbi:aspartate aminotransferase family protein [Pseudoroseicyclus tamaricis]|uniref:Aspartate aminotransferase family protein n=1 Tax=Pseudoroseicyclus tamaricis TaxID=2705421 RepID=A0A6B2JGF7_9RHOB|nr:aspartate aminotransferase family protein [Pseudoroseicyclus tamaricis]NDV00271.1 aspartate aminotransferase family protein [Pseudoroseicyclus tamaricis]
MDKSLKAFSFDASAAWNAEAASVIAGSVNSNVRLAGAPMPLCFTRGKGAHLWDIDGNRFLDYALGMGPTILGHAPEAVNAAVADSLAQGQLFAGQHPAELDLAKALVRHIPSAQLTRVGMTGSEMVQAALRVSRAFTGKPKFIKFEGQYHGWYDNVLVSHAPRVAEPGEALPPRREPKIESKGQTEVARAEMIVLPWNDIAALEQVIAEEGGQIAAILTEPAMCNTGAIPPAPGYLERMRELATAENIVLIFDEVITGFRLGLGGGQERFGVTPDLSTFAKAMAGGYPVAALVGRADIMEMFATSGVNHSGTYNSNVQSIVAAVATLAALEDGTALARAEATGEALMEGLRGLARETGTPLRVEGWGTAFSTFFAPADHVVTDYQSFKAADGDMLQRFLSELVHRGVRPTNRGTWFVSSAHDEEDVAETLEVAREALTAL